MINRRLQRQGPSIPQRVVNGVPYELQVVQRVTERATRKARADQHAKAKRVKVVANGPGDFTVSHGLGFKPRSFVPVKTKQPFVHTVVNANSRSLTINADATGTMEFEVY